ncbi:Dual specificity protein phosphatase PPS1 [Elsinoe australis]|uniref:Dual specificity protein phosphatase PPS1 n=1 Tax=Elsinoe australis TaxID=40998 RepID=A0A2P7ZD88_9PEZI|nr:Dual specificity protein phosphatase PPS1 [Elsinoe australis]
MAEVLSYPRKPNGQSYYSNSPLKRSSNSYSSFLSQAASPYTPTRTTPPSPPCADQNFSSNSLPSTTTTSAYQSFTDLSSPSSLPPTPASSVSFEDKDDREEEDIAFPSYDDGVQFYHQDEPLDLPPSPSDDSDASSTAQEEPSNRSDSTRSDSPLPTPTVADDTAVKTNPSRHVDYLSHDWREEDIWSSWRHIVSQRKVYGQRSRLENASWRTWAKSKYQLPTVSPETLNWLKESDVTWLYGPLQPATSHPITHSTPDPSPHHISSQSSFVNKKPILKKRSMSEVMLQRSLSASSLLKQAAASVQAQQTAQTTPRPAATLVRGHSDFNSSQQSQSISRDQLDYFSTISSSSGGNTPSEGPKRHIRFDDKVEQCIAVDCKDHDQYDDDSSEDDSDSDSSDDGVLTMRKPKRRRPTIGKRSGSRNGMGANKIIEKLPDTTLKYKTESPEQPRTVIQLPFLGGWGATYGSSSNSSSSTSSESSRLTQSASQETIRPTDPSRNFLLDDDDDADRDMSWLPPKAYGDRRDGGSTPKPRMEDSDEGPSNMRRTPSGMFMPYEDDDDEVATELGLFGRVSETINTAKDIAHVIWNVGWRK